MKILLYVTFLLILIRSCRVCFGRSETNESSCSWQKQVGLVTTQLPSEKVLYRYAVNNGRYSVSYVLEKFASSIQLGFNYWIKHGNVSVVIESEEYLLHNIEQEKWSSYDEQFKNLTASSQILIIAHLDDEGVFALTELQIKINSNENITEFLCASFNGCSLWKYEGFRRNIYHPYFVLGNDTRVEAFTNTRGRHEVLNLRNEREKEQELNITYYVNGRSDKKAELVLFYQLENGKIIEIWKDETFEPVWKNLLINTESYLRPYLDYSIIIQANTDEDTLIALSSLHCNTKEYLPSMSYAYKIQSALNFSNVNWILETDSGWHHHDSDEGWYLYLSSEDKQAVFRSWWMVPKKENFVRMKYRKRGRGETKIAIYLKKENNQKRILKRLIVVNSEWEILTIPFSIEKDFYISIKGTVNGEDTQLHLTQLSVNDPCHLDPCRNGKCIVNNETNFECQCDFGYIGVTCELIDWCSINYQNISGYDFCRERNASCKNVIDADTFTCACHEKLQYFNIDEGCIDLDLCELNECGSHAICKNNSCFCKKHYESEIIENRLFCKPINYCLRKVCGEAKCLPGDEDRPEEYKCYCDSGFVYRNKKCENNMCNFPSFNQCEQQCLVINDHYQCSCGNGFELVNNSTCAISDRWMLNNDTEYENGICVMNLSTNITSCICKNGYVYEDGKCIDYCSFNNGSVAKNLCPSGKCVKDAKNIYKCLCEGEYKLSEDGVTCALRDWCKENEEGYLYCKKNNAKCEVRDKSYRCFCQPGTEENENGICTNITQIGKYITKCLAQTAHVDLNLENRPICVCGPYMSFINGKCSISPFTYSGILAVAKKFLKKHFSLSYLENIIHESMIQTFEKSAVKVDYRASAILECLEEKVDFICKVNLFFNEEAERQINLIKNNVICIDDTEYCILPPRLLINRYKLETIIFKPIDFCRDVSNYYCSEQTYCRNKVIPEVGFTCKCQTGYEVYNIYYPDNSMSVAVEQCKDIDECSNRNPCPKNSNCINTMGSYQCQCIEGYRVKLQHEHVHEECIPVCDPNPCEHGQCIKIAGEFKCKCDAGYTGILCDEEDTNFKRLNNNLIIIVSTLSGALVLTFIIAYVLCTRAKKKLEKKSAQIIQMVI
ncbi:fibrillin-2-like isoform X2 [Centruroides vittatus]|uniref:fibrillin-2-like isoform X2 n=1 Tax=Centruroides vittatus TaxID=120091 RepID=UPI003510B268